MCTLKNGFVSFPLNPTAGGDFFWVLKFWASLVPHTGIDDVRGYFLVAYGAYGDFDKFVL